MMDKLAESIIKPLLKEIELPVKVGDTVLMGRFKNKKVKVKSVKFNDRGDLMINGRPALKFRIAKSDKKLLPAKKPGKDSVSPDADMKGVKENGIVAGDGTIQGGSKLSKIKKMKKKGHSSVPYGSGYKKVKEASCAKKSNVETAAQYRKRCGPRPLGQIPKIHESEVKTIHSLIQKFGNSSKDATDMIKKNYKRVAKKFYGQTPRDKAMALIGLSLLGEEWFSRLIEAPRKPRKKGMKRNSKKHSDLYTDENPKGTIHGLKFVTPAAATKSVSKIRSSGRSHAHKIQAAIAMEQRARAAGKTGAAAVYRKFINQMKKKTKAKNEIKEQKEIKKTIGIYGGRFQPFHSGHMATYKWLKAKVDDVYITTSNIKKPPRHPMNFKEKVEHMVKMGVPKNRIVEEASPYVAKNTLKKFNSDTTAVVYAFGAKDAGRLKAGKKKDGSKTYYQDYKKSKGDIKGFEEHGYFVTAPQQGNLSGTKTREMLGNPKVDDKEKTKFFKKAFGYYDKKMYIKMTKNFGKLFEIYISLLESSISGNIEGVDDGPHSIAPGVNRYIGRAKKEAEKLGFDIVNSLVNADACLLYTSPSPRD